MNHKFLNLLKLIVNKCDKEKTKIIAYDRNSFDEVQGKVIKLYIPLETISEMESDLEEMQKQEQKIKGDNKNGIN